MVQLLKDGMIKKVRSRAGDSSATVSKGRRKLTKAQIIGHNEVVALKEVRDAENERKAK